MTTEQMCADARVRVTQLINRSAGQHVRAMRKPRQQPTDQQRVLSDELYCLAMRLTDAGAKNIDALIAGFCELAEVRYPPQPMEKT